MEFNHVKKQKQHRGNVTVGGSMHYDSGLQMFSVPPVETISLQEFEELALDRVKALKAIETLGIRHVRTSKEYMAAMRAELKKYPCMNIKDAEGEGRRKDHISHFILRLAYSRTEDLRRWFIAQELDLFRYRFLVQMADDIQKFLANNNLSYIPISKDEKRTLLEKLKSSRSHGMSENDVETSEYYKVPFTEALELVRSLKVYLERGFVFVPQTELVVIIMSVFRSNLSHSLVVTSRAVLNLAEEERLLPMLSNLSRQYLGADYTNRKSSSDHITADMLDSLSTTSFPLCMQQLHSSIRVHHHLKHWGRQQYGLFLKGIGMTLDEALKFWRSEFTRIMDADKFDKQYAYNVRHNYGKEGKRADYTPYSCIKIITSNVPSAGDFHGCPFRHSDADNLKQRLQSMRVSSDGISEVLDLVKQGHYQLACGRYFELKHNTDFKFAPQHPNQYFEESRKQLSENKAEGSSAKASSGGAAVIVPVRSTGVVNRSSATTRDDFNDEDDAVLSMCVDNDGDDILLASSMDEACSSLEPSLG